jgi:hypothetical protein
MKKYEKKICSNPECNQEFEAKVYNAIYCSQACRRIVTNKNLLNNYYEKKRNKNKKRVCKTKTCTTILSTYNKENICEQCKGERFIQRLISWGYDEEKLRKEI